MSDDLVAAVRAAVQAILDAEGDGWNVAQVVVCMGLEKFNANGQIESIPWLWSPPSQPDWMTQGLLESATDLHQEAECDEED